MLPVIVYLVYDLWYRLLSRKKPYHHPERWPPGLVVYLALLFAGSIGLNWYGYLVSQLCGSGLVVAFFVMMGCYGYYQYSHNKKLWMTNEVRPGPWTGVPQRSVPLLLVNKGRR